jgi:VWFA-related protein
LAVTLVLETSSHLEMMAPVIRSLGSIFGETVMALNGEAAVLTYDATVDLRQNFTRDHDAVERAVADVQFEAPELHLYDAMAAAVDLLKTQPENLRRVMVIVGESQDTGSAAKLGLVLREAELANIAIYAVGPSSSAADLRFGELEPLMLPGTSVPMTTHGPGQNRIGRNFYDWMGPAMWVVTRGTNEIKNHQLEVATAATGGVHYRALREATMRDALDRIGGELHSQYIVSYTPAGEVEGFHAIRIEVTRPGSVVRTRPGYFRTRPEDEVDVTGRKKGPAVPVQHFFAAQ